MPDPNVVDEVVLTDEQKKAAADAAAAEAAEAAEIESGYADAPTEKTPPADDEAAKTAAAEAEKVAADKAAADAATALAAVPKHRQVTEDEWTQLNARVAQIDQMPTRKELDKAFGKVGGLERTLATIQSATPAGYAVEVTDEIVADITKEFPELGALTLKAFKTFASKLKGTAPAAPAAAAAPDPEAIGKIATAQLVALQTEALDDDRPDWRETVGTQESKNPFRTWLATQPPEYQAKLASTNSAIVISRAILKFEDAKAAADKVAVAAAAKAAAEAAEAAKVKAAADKRRGVIAAAVPPRGSGGHTASSGPTDDDDFNDGFKNG